MEKEAVRLFVAALPEEGARVALSDEASRHAHVLRLVVGDRVCLFDGTGSEMDGAVVAIERGVVVCVGERARPAVTTGPKVCLVQAIPKAKKLDGILRMATELGVDEIRLASSERAISRMEEARTQGKLDRLTRIAREAARQSRRSTVPTLHPSEPLLTAAGRAPNTAAKLVFWERADEPLPARIEADEVWVVVGPEGGLSHIEVSALRTLGYRAHTLGQNILRVETASPVALALVLDRLGRLSSSG
jgi:16S rRNA (uracil1498-N3)-methyltransferase